MQDADAALLDAWGAGDSRAGRELFDRHFAAIYRFVSSKVSADVEDLVQEVFLVAVSARDSFRRDSTFRTFLYGIARRVLLAYYRKRGTSRERFDGLETSATDVAPDPAALVVAREDRRILAQALRRIPLELQIIVELYYFEELTAAEVATVVEVPLGTVRSRLRRALEAVKAEISNGEQGTASTSSWSDTISRWLTELRLARAAGG